MNCKTDKINTHIKSKTKRSNFPKNEDQQQTQQNDTSTITSGKCRSPMPRNSGNRNQTWKEMTTDEKSWTNIKIIKEYEQNEIHVKTQKAHKRKVF